MTEEWNLTKEKIASRIARKAGGRGSVRVVVHDGIFHADDVMCVALIKALSPLPVEVVRTREIDDYKGEGFILDVGGEDGEGDDFLHLDHHQEDSGARENGVKMAACGKLADWIFRDAPGILSELHRQFLAQIEAMDNGQEMPELGAHVLSFVYTFNGTWLEVDENERRRAGDASIRAYADEAFDEAVRVAVLIVGRMLRRIVDDMAAEPLVDEAIRRSERGIIYLDKYMPWKPSVIKENKRRKERGEFEKNPLLLIVFPGMDKNYHIQCVPVDFHTFEDEINLPECWAGLSGEALAEATGIDDAVFCHKGRFMAIFRSKESAVKAAEMIIRQAKNVIEGNL